MKQVIMSFFSGAHGFAYANPISSLITGAFEALFLDKRFEQVQWIVVNVNPVIEDSFGVKGQYLAGEVLNGDPW
jgi:hypothetical protein